MSVSTAGRLGRRLGLVVLAAAVLVLPSCGKRRKTCYPVRGTVLVNGKPAKDLVIVFNPKDESGEERLAPTGQTDAAGGFRLSTYDTDDGAPAGDYVVTFTWREASGLLKNQFDGPDRLKGRYNDPKKAEFPVTVEKGAAELPPFKLEVK